MAGVTLRVTRIRGEVDRQAANAVAQRHSVLLVTEVTRLTFNRANILAPVRTGNLRAHHGQRVRASSRKVVGEVFNNANYAAAVHDGSAPHVIRARRKKALKFKIGGRVFIRRQVRHPGTTGRPWLSRAGQEIAARHGFLWHPE